MPPRDATERALVDWAASVDAVRAVLLVGSRAAAAGATDALSDYDVLLFLRYLALEESDAWLSTFGDVLVRLDTSYDLLGHRVPTRLVQFADGRRIDFSLCPVALLQRLADDGRLPDALDAGYRVLLDRDGLASRLSPPSGRAFVRAAPSPARYAEVVNEFWWEALYVARNLARRELMPARYSAECVLRFRCLLPMLEWDVERERGWTQPLGSIGRGLADLLAPRERALLNRTYAGVGVEESWVALLALTKLFELAAARVAANLGYAYPEELARGAKAYLGRLRRSDGLGS